MSQGNAKKPIVMARVVRLEDADRSFDLEFWERVGPEGRLKAMGDLVLHYLRLKGIPGTETGEPELQRSVERVQRGGR
jgi:hypothetical protein